MLHAGVGGGMPAGMAGDNDCFARISPDLVCRRHREARGRITHAQPPLTWTPKKSLRSLAMNRPAMKVQPPRLASAPVVAVSRIQCEHGGGCCSRALYHRRERSGGLCEAAGVGTGFHATPCF